MQTSSPIYFFAGIIALISLIMLPDLVYAQVNVDRLQRRAEQRINRKLQREVDKSVDKTIDRSFDAAKQSAKGNEKDEYSDGVIFSAEDEKPHEAKPNAFIGSVKMHVKELDRNGNVKKDGEHFISYTIDTWQMAIRIFNKDGREESRMIYNIRENNIITITDFEKKEGIKVTPPNVRMRGDKEDEEFRFSSTGVTRKIHGYLAEEYLYRNDEGQGEVWLTRELKEFADAMMNFRFIQQNSGAGYMPLAEYGMWLEHQFTYKNGDRSEAEIQEVVTDMINPAVFDVSDYKINDLSGMRPYGGR